MIDQWNLLSNTDLIQTLTAVSFSTAVRIKERRPTSFGVVFYPQNLEGRRKFEA